MTNTKKIIIVGVAVVALVLAVLGFKFGNRLLPDKETTTAEPTGTTAEWTTIKPLVEAQTEILTPTTVKPYAGYTTEPYNENSSRISEESGWKDNDLTNGLPKIKTGAVSTVNYVSDKGRRTVIRIDTFDYNSYLKYIERLEKAGFADNNGKAHIPQNAPSDVAMFYSRFDGQRSFGVYWYGNNSSAGFDCEIVISDYDQAK